ncbi:MAG: hypothetical protein F6K30_25010, partial [Cyanothece sp. SIO2G6]|nr:hypothetical protein [Cyanothece sp. SIO2G6]
MSMQAQFPPPESSDSSVAASSSRSASHSPLPNFGQDSAKDVSSTDSTISLAEMAVLRQAAQAGEFRAIATLLNQAVQKHDILVWVGEAGPGCLQITLTVQRPPKQEPLIRLIAHHLCLLQSDIIKSSNITAQLAATNLILWHQLVRLPPPKQPAEPASWQMWRKQLPSVLQASWQQGLVRIGKRQRALHTAWQERWPQIKAQCLAQSRKVRSLPQLQFKRPQLSSPPPQASSSAQSSVLPSPQPTITTPDQPTGIAATRLPSHLLEQGQKPIVPPFQAPASAHQQPDLDSVSTAAPPPPPLPTAALQWTELAMLPMTWPPTASVATPTPTPASQPDQAASSTSTTPAPPLIPP